MKTSNKIRAEDRYLVASLEFEGVLRACLHRYARNAADVDELLQETYAHLLAAGAAKGREEVRSIRAFALTVARNVALSWLRHRQVVPIELVADLEALELLDETGQVDEIVNTHQELALLTARGGAACPNRCRQVFTLRKVYGLSQKEIAAELEHLREHRRATSRQGHAPVQRRAGGFADGRAPLAVVRTRAASRRARRWSMRGARVDRQRGP